MEIAHGGLTIDIPETWSDQSTLLFSAPREGSSLPTAQPVEEPTEAVCIKLLMAPEGTAQELLAAQATQLREIDPNLEILAEGPFACGLGPGWRCHQRFLLAGGSIEQLAVVCVLDGVAVLATASAVTERFPRREQELVRILGSLRFTHPQEGEP